MIVITNDDGVHSPGLLALADGVAPLGELRIVGPEEPRSGTSMSLTFHKPLRVAPVLVGRRKAFAVSGSPADAVMVAVHQLTGRTVDLVLSGINFGDNVSFQDVFASGTVAAAIEAAIKGLPAVAFSMEVPDEQIFAPGSLDLDFRQAADIARQIAGWVLRRGLPEGVHLLNVNFPAELRPDTPVRITRLARKKFRDYVLERRDPRGRPYYWIWGERLTEFDRHTDAYVVHDLQGISVTPLGLDLTADVAVDLESLREGVTSSLTTLPAHKEGT
jgi:5'-nucleotidase